MPAAGANRGFGVEHPSGSRTHGGVDSPEIGGVGIHGLSEGEAGVAVVPPIRTLRQALLGTTFVVTRVLREHDWAGRSEDTQVCPVARSA